MLATRVVRLAVREEEGDTLALVEGFRRVLLLHLTARTWIWALRDGAGPWGSTWASGSWIPMAVAGGVSVGAALSLVPELRRRGELALVAALVVKLLVAFPTSSNHFYLELSCAALVACLDAREVEERALLLAGLRWMFVTVLFYTGAQKLLYGTWVDGQFLAFQVATEERFAFALGWALPAEELQRLTALGPPVPGAGPYVASSAVLPLIGNAVWIAEVILPVLLMVRRTRAAAVVATLVFAGGLAVVSRELLFAVDVVALTLLFARRPFHRWLLPALPVLYIVVIAAQRGSLFVEWLN